MKLKLIKGLSFSNGRIFVEKSNPFIDVEESEGEKLVSSGYFEEVVEPAEEVVEPAEEDSEYIIPPVDFDKMTVNALKAYAEENRIDISGLTRKDDIKQALLDYIDNQVPEIFTE